MVDEPLSRRVCRCEWSAAAPQECIVDPSSVTTGTMLARGVRPGAVRSFRRVKATDKLIRKLSKGDESVGWLQSLPGVGPFISVLIRWEVDNIERFASAKRFASYTGLVPSTYSSANRTVHGRLTKQGNRWLRWAFVEAVTPAVRVSPQLATFYRRLKERRGAKDARAATARKLAELAWTVWTERRCYVENK